MSIHLSSQTQATNSLQQLLYELVHQAQRTPGTLQIAHLPNGLLIELFLHDRRFHLQLSCEAHLPRMEDYWEILDLCPANIGRVLPSVKVSGGREVLTTSWPATSEY